MADDCLKGGIKLKLLLFSIIILGGVGAIVAALTIVKEVNTWSNYQVEIAEPKIIELAKGESLSSFSKKLAENGLVKHPYIFYWWVRTRSKYSQFQAGRYLFSERKSPQEIVDTLIKGSIYTPVIFEYNIPEGFTTAEIFARLSSRGIGSQGDYAALSASREFLNSLGLKNAVNLEGFLFPATYRFYETPTPEIVLREAVGKFFKTLPVDYEERLKARGLSLVDAVAFASLIEEETSFDDEKPKISEVIWRRLNSKMPLGIDAAIIYGIKDYKGNITRAHLADKENRYNNRIHLGLPPTPICSPAINSLLAVLTPSNEGFLFYVLAPDTPGRHVFSRTLAEHEQNVKKLVRAGRM